LGVFDERGGRDPFPATRAHFVYLALQFILLRTVIRRRVSRLNQFLECGLVVKPFFPPTLRPI
jgi:hypothetical protein